MSDETARELLYRHGLPEDVIDGVLCLHAQELAIKARSTDLPEWADDLDLFDNGVAWVADLVDPAVPDNLAGTANARRYRTPDLSKVVAYRNPDRPGVLLCRFHGDGWWGLTPLTSEDLPDGGICTYGDPADPSTQCGVDVLIPQKPATPAP